MSCGVSCVAEIQIICMLKTCICYLLLPDAAVEFSLKVDGWWMDD